MAEASPSRATLDTPDPQLAARAREYDHEALDQLFRRTFDRVHSILQLSSGGVAEAETAAAEIYRHVLGGVGKLEGGPRQAESWVLRLAAERRPSSGPLTALSGTERETILLRVGGGIAADAAAEILFRKPFQVQQALARGLRQLAGPSSAPALLPAEVDAAIDAGRFEGAPELEAAGRLAEQLRPVPTEVRERVRSQFLGAAEERRAVWVHRHHVPAGVPWARPHKPSLHIGEGVALILIAVLAVAVGAMFALFASLSDPSTPFGLYSLKRGGEDVLLLAQRDRVKHADLELKLSQTRQKEAETMAASGHADLAVAAARDHYSNLRAAYSDLGRTPAHTAAWKSERDKLEQEASKEPVIVENSLSSGGFKSQAAEVKALNQEFQNDRKALDAALGVKLQAPAGGPTQQGATPTPTPPQ